jgi:hypothetical protein
VIYDRLAKVEFGTVLNNSLVQLSVPQVKILTDVSIQIAIEDIIDSAGRASKYECANDALQ